jgi:hypothetical protein
LLSWASFRLVGNCNEVLAVPDRIVFVPMQRPAAWTGNAIAKAQIDPDGRL